ncbi:MAG TPA: TlpA disulfide reductase family protein [Bryobacteraceae bacterium]|nr:TlpA disulfide reductase family protein [Bryobacteraceae bacterium]
MNRAAVLALISAAPVLMAQSIAGLWQGTVTVNGTDIPFRFEIAGDGGNVTGTFFNGDERYTSTSGNLANNGLELNWDYFASKLTATVSGDAIDGTYARGRGRPMPFHAHKGLIKVESAGAPSIDGVWILEGVDSSKGEQAWSFIVEQKGAEISAAILRVDGDTGTLTGAYHDGKFTVSHFSGQRPALVEASLNPDGTLKVVEGRHTMTGYRPDEVRAKGLPEPTDPTKHTGVKNAAERFHFAFTDLNGNLVSDTDARFKDKVVLVDVFGSWCPNCHDEAPFLEETYRKYRSQGLEVVGLSFEEADQLKNPTRLRAFMKRYGIDYTVLLCGTTDQAKEKLSQASNWDAWPTTFILGRDGRVRAVHTGFPSKASGELYTKAKQEFTEQVEHLLSENALTLRHQ